MAIGSILSNFKSVKLSTADGKSYSLKMSLLNRLAIKIFGIPHLGFKNRARKILNIVGSLKKINRVLDAGAGYGIYSMMLAEKGYNVDSIDISKERIKEISKRTKEYPKIQTKINAKVGSLTKLPYPPKSFDLIICSEVIEHISKDSIAMWEMARVLKKGGSLILTVPTESSNNKKIYRKFGHVRPGYSINKIRELAQKNNFEIKEVSFYEYKLGDALFKIHNDIKSKIGLALSFYFLYLGYLLDGFIKIGEPNQAVVLLEKK